jgi:thiol-disulfide isomerase/thioredoxin
MFFVLLERLKIILFQFILVTVFSYAQKNFYQFHLKLNDSVSLKIPVIIDNSNISIPAYPSAIKYQSPLKCQKDSCHFSVSLYENKCVIKKHSQNFYSGNWLKYSGTKVYSLPCSINPLKTFPYIDSIKMKNFPDKWTFKIHSKNSYSAKAVFRYYNNFVYPYLSGSVATPYGDLGNLNGYLTKNDSLYLSVFNGSFATQILAKVFYSKNNKSDSIVGFIYYGNWGVEKFSAIPDTSNYFKNEINLSDIFSNTNFTLQHQWKDIDGKEIILEQNKPIVLLIMGSWCPNCTDENKLFSEWYNTLSKKIQIIALSVERTNDLQKSITHLKNYRQKLNIPYPIVLLSEKGNQPPFSIFLEINKIPAFPTTIYFDKSHRPFKATIGFNGPSTLELYDQTKQHIQDYINELIN